MNDKQAGLNEIYSRIKNARIEMGIKSFKWSHETTEIDGKKLPCVFMGCGDDYIVEYNARSYLGYPAKRTALIYIELVCRDGLDIEAIYGLLKSKILSSFSVSNTGFIREIKTSGPYNYNMPGIKAMVLTLGLNYIDAGT